MHELFLNNRLNEAITKLVEKIFNEVLLCQSAEQLAVKPYKRTDKRQTYLNGFHFCGLTTRMGKLNLRIPCYRNVGEFSTELFNRY